MQKRTPHHVFISFSGTTLTHFGGIYLLQSFFKRLKLRKQLHHHLQFPQRNNRYTTSEEMLALIYPITLGLGRIETTHLLKHNGVFQYLTGLPTYPNPTTLRRFLFRMAPLALPKLRKLHDRLLLSMILKPSPPTKVIFDLDSTVLTLYGKQEMARIGYNPQEVGSSLLSSASLFQWNHQRFLAWGTPPWRYPHRYWDRRTTEGSLCQTASLCKDRNYPSRQGFLRSRDHRISGIQESSFCHCGQTYRSGQERNHNLILSDPFLWSGDRGIYVSTHQVEKEISLCGGQASHPRRPYGTTHPLLNGQVQLSGYCDQHETDPSPYLEILQWPSRCRTDYQRTQRGLSFRKNPDKIFCSQRGLFPYPLILLQSHQLVQAIESAEGVPKHDS